LRIVNYLKSIIIPRNTVPINPSLPHGLLLPNTEADFDNTQAMIDRYFAGPLQQSELMTEYAALLTKFHTPTTVAARAAYTRFHDQIEYMVLQCVVPVLPYFTICLRFSEDLVQRNTLRCDYDFKAFIGGITEHFVYDYVSRFVDKTRILMNATKKNVAKQNVPTEMIANLFVRILVLEQKKGFITKKNWNISRTEDHFDDPRFPDDVTSPSLSDTQSQLLRQVWIDYRHYAVGQEIKPVVANVL